MNLFVEMCGVKLTPKVALRNGLDPNICHWVRREEPKKFPLLAEESGDNGNGGLIVEARSASGTSVVFKITEDDIHQESREFLLQTLGPSQGPGGGL